MFQRRFVFPHESRLCCRIRYKLDFPARTPVAFLEAFKAMTFAPIIPPEPPRVFGAPTLSASSELVALAISVDGSLWSVEEPGTIRQWHLATRRRRQQHHLDELATVWAFNWSGRLAASASDEVAIWEVTTGQRLASWSAPPDAWITALAFQPGAPVLATGHENGRVQVWDWYERRLLHEFHGHRCGVSAMAISRERCLAVAGEDRVIALYDLDSGSKIQTLADHTDRIPALLWHPDGRRLFSAGWDTTVRVWDVATGRPIILLNNHQGQVNAIALGFSGRWLAAADSDNCVHVWDTERYEEVAVLRTSTAEIRSLCFSPDDKARLSPPLLAYAGGDRLIYLWNGDEESSRSLNDSPLPRTTVAVDPSGRKLYTQGMGTALRGFVVDSDNAPLTLETVSPLRTFALSPDGRWLAVSRVSDESDPTAALSLLDADGRHVVEYEGQRSPITVLAFSTDSALLASGSTQSSDVWLWNVPRGEPALLIPDAVDACGVEALAWCPASALLAVAGIDYLSTGGDDGEIVLWDTVARVKRRILPGGVTALAFSPDGRWLAAADLGRWIVVYDAETGVRRWSQRGHRDTVTSLAFSRDGRHLATGGDDRTLRLWNATTGEALGAWELDDQVRGVTFGPDGRFVYTGNGNASCYQLEVDDLLASANVYNNS